MTTPVEQRALFGLLLHAAIADGVKSDAERSALKRITEGFAPDAFNPWTLYQEVLAGRYPIDAVVADLTTPASRLLAYEMALGVCETDGPPNAAEQRFLTDLKARLALRNEADASQHNAEVVAQALPAAAPTSGAAPASPAETPAKVAPVDTAALDKSILNHAILTGALELLPQSLATMAVVPLQMKLVYGIGKAHGYTLDRGHIRDFIATAGAGLAAQAVEGYARKLVGGLLGGMLGKGMIGNLGRAAATTATGAAITFAATYAIGQLALRYYAGGRRMETAVLKDTYRTLLDDGRRLFGVHRSDIEHRAATLTPTEVINLVRQP
ncbi:MAG: GTPase [Opitutaceae bacterium]|nr:GTPase [Opitutaceae bacterium]